MDRETRLRIFEKELRRLLLDLEHGDWLVFEDSADPDRYVQFLVRHSGVRGEVGSKHWLAESSGLRKASIQALGCLGFEGGGPKRNFARDYLPHDARRLACMTELLFGAAYGDMRDMTPVVRTRAGCDAVPTPAAAHHDA